MRIVASAGVNAPEARRMDNTNRKSRGKMAQTTIKQNSFPYMKNDIMWPNTRDSDSRSREGLPRNKTT